MQFFFEIHSYGLIQVQSIFGEFIREYLILSQKDYLKFLENQGHELLTCKAKQQVIFSKVFKYSQKVLQFVPSCPYQEMNTMVKFKVP